MPRLKSIFVSLVFTIGIKPVDAWSIATFIYVPSLTGHYVVGEHATFDGGMATLKQETVALPWSGGSGPRYINYELSGFLGEPRAVVGGPLGPYEDPAKINFNGAFTVSPRPGYAWGSTLNENIDWTSGSLSFNKKYYPETGKFYLGLSGDVYASYSDPCCSPWPDVVSTVIANVYSIFYNYIFFSAPVQFTDPGFVFVESARVGLSDLPLSSYNTELEKIVEYPAHVPEPSTILLMISVAIALVAMRIGRFPVPNIRDYRVTRFSGATPVFSIPSE